MLTLFAGILLALLFLLKIIAVYFPSISFLAFVNTWFVWLFAGIMFLLLYASTKRFFISAILTAVIGLIMRLIIKV